MLVSLVCVKGASSVLIFALVCHFSALPVGNVPFGTFLLC